MSEGLGPSRSAPAAAGVLAAAVAALVVLSIPVIVEGAPLADDFTNCRAPVEQGLTGFLEESADRLGAVRPARFVEILVTTGICQNMPFGFAIAVPLALYVAVAFLLAGLLRDLGLRSPWPELGAGLWLLQPLGTESALWPAALHVPLGLAAGILTLRLHRRGHVAWAVAAGAVAMLSVEQVILALPVAAWLTAGPDRRRTAAVTTTALAAVVVSVYLAFPGNDPRLDATVVDRLTSLTEDPSFYAEFPAVGVGAHSIPLAVWWAFPFSAVAVLGGALLGLRWGRAVPPGTTAPGPVAGIGPAAAAVSALLVAVNVLVVLNVPRQGSPRLFAPTWLVLAGLAAFVVPAIHRRRPAVTGALVGVFAVGAVLSLALSVSVRLRTADFTEASSDRLAALVDDGAVIGVCGVERTVVDPAPRGAFAVHELLADWSARRSLAYYTDRRAQFELAGDIVEGACPDETEVDVVVRFDDLVQAWRRS